MKRLFLVVGTILTVLPWLSGARAQADVIQWTASMSLPGGGGGDGGTQIYSQNVGPQGILTLIPGPTMSGTNSGSVVLTSLYAFDQANSNAVFSGPSGNYSLNLTLRDAASGSSGSLTFRGNLSGSVDPQEAPSRADITNTFVGPTTQTLTLGRNLYTVTIGSFVPPGNPGDPVGGGGTVGSLSASITAQPAVNSAPEPSTLLLTCLGVPSLGLAGWLWPAPQKRVQVL